MNATAAICHECRELAQYKIFKNALRVKMPRPAHMKFVPVTYGPEELGELYNKYHGLEDLVKKVCLLLFCCTLPCLSKPQNLSEPAKMLGDFVRCVLAGEFAKHEVLLGAVQAALTTLCRKAKDLSMKNMSYPPAFDNICGALAIIGPRAYRLFMQHFGGRGERSQRCANPAWLCSVAHVCAVKTVRAIVYIWVSHRLKLMLLSRCWNHMSTVARWQ